MSEPAEDITPDEEIGIYDPTTETVHKKSEFTRPPYTFKGIPLYPYTYGYELLFNQVRDAEDTGLYTWFAFIYLLAQRKHGGSPDSDVDHRKWAVSIAWNVKSFRESLAAWMDFNGPFTIEDKIEAKRIYEENMKAIAEATVEPVPTHRKAQKKTSRQRTQSSSTSSAINSGVVVTKSFGG